VRIALDIDGVIADIQTELEIRLKKDYDISIAREDWHTFLIEKQFPEVSGDWVMNQFADPSFYLNAICYPAAWYMVNKWFMSGNDVFLVTCRGPAHGEKTVALTERWLDEWEIGYNRLYHSQTRLEKYKTLVELEIDLFVEDDPHEVRLASEYVNAFLMDHPYNRDSDIGSGTRISSLYQVDPFIRGNKFNG
jgi:uncharacterized HAD superfamily protein